MVDESWFVVGAGGFLGSRLAQRLLHDEHGLRLSFGLDLAKPDWLDELSGKPEDHFIEGDWLTIPLDELEVLTAKAHVWVVCASVLPFRSRAFDHSANVRIAERVVELYRRRAQVGRPPFIIFISSSSIYGFPARTPLGPDSQELPVDDYGKSKLQAEQIYRQIPDGDLAVIRPRTILGAGRGGTVDALSRLSKRGFPVPVPQREVILQLCHVEDLVSLIIHLGAGRISGLWPAFSLLPKTLEAYVRQSKSLDRSQVRLFRVPASSERLFGFVVGLRLSPFTNWHIAGFFRSHVFQSDWLPAGFSPKFTCQEAFDEALR